MKDDVNVTDLPPDPVAVTAEANIAEHFADVHRDDLRYVAKWNRWLKFDGKRWQEEDTLLAFDLVRALCKELAIMTRGNTGSEEKRLLNSKTIAGIERIARTDRKMAARTDQWNKDPWLLNTPDGAVNLKDGTMGPHQIEHYATKMTSVGPGGDCRRWLEFLKWFTSNDQELENYLQRVCGYFLTGDASEEALWFLFGTGQNGKGTFVRTLSYIMGDYHKTTPVETLTASSVDRHPTELAELQGAKLVTASETEKGRRWNESQIKRLTGRDRIPARFMRQDFFEYDPEFKLLISGNNRPGLRTVDKAMRRRFNLIACLADISMDAVDTRLADKLQEEAGGILRWMIEGCLKWQKEGLKPPASVIAKTDEYLESEDAFSQWLEECCDLDPNNKDSFDRLWRSWKQWAEGSGEFVGTKKSLGSTLMDRKFKRTQATTGKREVSYVGLSVQVETM